MDYTSISLTELNNRVDMIEMAVALGYREYRAKSSRASKFFILGDKDSHWDRILISPSKKHPGQLHFMSLDFSNGGDGASMLVKHALERSIIRDPLAASMDPRDINIFRKVAKVLCDHLMIPDEDRVRMRYVVHELKKGEPFKEEIARKIMAPALYPILFSRRGISRDTFNSPLFKGTWSNCNPDADGRRKKSDLCFPCYKADGSIGGLNYRYWKEDESKCSSRLLTGSEHSESVWHSNIPERISRVVITESEFDCMAHYQLDPQANANTLYISHQGYLIPSQVDCVMEILSRNIGRLSPDFKLILGADNDDAGSRYDLQIIKKIAEQKKDTFSLDLPIHNTGTNNIWVNSTGINNTWANNSHSDSPSDSHSNSPSDNYGIMMGDGINGSGLLTTITIPGSRYEKFKELTIHYLDTMRYLEEGRVSSIDVPSINVRSIDVSSIDVPSIGVRSLDVRFLDESNTVQILRTKNDNAANTALSELILNSDLLIRNVRREKSIEKDWNDDLKMLNKINSILFEHLSVPKRIDYQGYREIATDYRLHRAALKDATSKECLDNSRTHANGQDPKPQCLKKVTSPELKKLVKEYLETHPHLFHEAPDLVKEMEESRQLSPETEERLRQAKKMFRR